MKKHTVSYTEQEYQIEKIKRTFIFLISLSIIFFIFINLFFNISIFIFSVFIVICYFYIISNILNKKKLLVSIRKESENFCITYIDNLIQNKEKHVKILTKKHIFICPDNYLFLSDENENYFLLFPKNDLLKICILIDKKIENKPSSYYRNLNQANDSDWNWEEHDSDGGDGD